MRKTQIQINGEIVKNILLNGKCGALLNFKWGVSKGRDTYGYNICSCYIDGYKVGTCNGGGYDMEGASVSEFLNNAFSEELLLLAKKRKDGELYGLNYYKTEEGKESVYTSGACGLKCMIHIINALGFKTDYKWNKKDGTMYYIYRDTDIKTV